MNDLTITITLTDEQVDIIAFALVETYFFDGYRPNMPDHPEANAICVLLGFDDRSKENE